MTRTTIDFGIDLGTTNSAIAVLKGIEPETIRNNEGSEYTPSVVYLDKHNNLVVGRGAKERVESDPHNAFSEFKLQMGTNEVKRFARNGTTLKPEQLSAEVLKALKADVRQRLGEEIDAAVITVPAAFDLPQCSATDRAAKLAGISTSPLLLEPVAAALSYGFQRESERVYWFVYDFGGGTFDAAIIQVRDGVIKVVNHGGDNHLGGKDIDWAIVEQVLIPALTKQHELPDLRRGNPRWFGTVAKLKQQAEQAKIRLSRDQTADIFLQCIDDDGKQIQVDFEHQLRRSDLERLAEPFFRRSLNICKQTLSQQKMDPSKIEKVLLVGGPTLTPCLRERLADNTEGLGIPLEFGIDPLTIVARGAAIFAGTQRLAQPQLTIDTRGSYSIDLEYKPVGIDREPLVGGRIRAEGVPSFAGWTIEFINAGAQPPWRSGKVELASNGAFMTTLWADKGQQNIFEIELLDQHGGKHPTHPHEISYTVGIAVTGQSLIHSVGVAMADNKVDWFFEKGTPLPTPRIRRVHRTAYAVRHGQKGEAIRIPIVEGTDTKADLNHRCGRIEIASTNLKRDVPAGSEIEITIEIDDSRLLKASAYVPVIDEVFEWGQKLITDEPDLHHIKEELPRMRRRLDRLRANVQDVGDSETQSVLNSLDEESVLDVERKLEIAKTDRSVADECESDLQRFKSELGVVEDIITLPLAIAEARQMIEWTEKVVEAVASPEQKKRFGLLRQELMAALNNPNAEVLRRRTDEMNDLRLTLAQSQVEWWTGFFQYVEGNREIVSDAVIADRLFAQGRRAMNSNNLDELKSACFQLAKLLPGEQDDLFRNYEGTTIKT